MPMLDTPTTHPQALADAAGEVIDRILTDADIPEVTAMERLACAHPLHAWTDDNYRSSLRAGYWARVRCDAATGRIVAVCVAMDGVDEVHLLNITVAPAFQRQGWAHVMLDALAVWARGQGAQWLWREVRASNERARRIYEVHGYRRVGERKRYYPAADGEREDAVVMSLLL